MANKYTADSLSSDNIVLIKYVSFSKIVVQQSIGATETSATRWQTTRSTRWRCCRFVMWLRRCTTCILPRPAHQTARTFATFPKCGRVCGTTWCCTQRRPRQDRYFLQSAAAAAATNLCVVPAKVPSQPWRSIPINSAAAAGDMVDVPVLFCSITR